MEGLGIDLTWFLFQLGNFIVLLVGLTYLLHKPLSKLLETRREEIRLSLENAETIKRELASTHEQTATMLEKARKDSALLLQETREHARSLEEQIRKEAVEKASRIAEQAEKDMARERERLRQELRSELADMVVTATGKVLSENLSPQKKEDLKKKVSSLT